VLSTFSFREADKIAQIYSLQLGRLKAVVKGARKPKSKLAASLELLTESTFSLHKKSGGDLYVLGQAKILDDYHELKQDFPTITLLQLLSDILIQSLQDHEPNAGLYLLLREILEALRSKRDIREQLLAAFCLKFLELSGFPLELSACVECGTSLERRRAVLIPHRGGALCEDCCATGPARLRISPAGLGTFRKLKSLPLEKIHVLKLKPTFARELFLTVLDYLERTIEKKLKTLDYYLKVI
jgi:DNA repair protein RecO (recombination protein O)